MSTFDCWCFLFKLQARMSLSMRGNRGCTWLVLYCGDSLSSDRTACAFYFQKHGVHVITERLVTVSKSLVTQLYNRVTFRPFFNRDLLKRYKCPDLKRPRGHYISNHLKRFGGHCKNVDYMSRGLHVLTHSPQVQTTAHATLGCSCISQPSRCRCHHTAVDLAGAEATLPCQRSSTAVRCTRTRCASLAHHAAFLLHYSHVPTPLFCHILCVYNRCLVCHQLCRGELGRRSSRSIQLGQTPWICIGQMSSKLGILEPQSAGGIGGGMMASY